MFARSWAGVFGCSGRGRGLPILESTEVRAFRAAPPLGAANEYISFVRAKRVLAFGYVRADGELTRHMAAAGWYTVLSAAAPCVRGCRWVLWCLRCAPRSAMAVSPACPAFVRAVTLSADAKGRRGGDIWIPLLGSPYQGFGFCVRTHRGACSLFVHLHLNRECVPAPAGAAVILVHLFRPLIHPSLLCFRLILLIGRKICPIWRAFKKRIPTSPPTPR